MTTATVAMTNPTMETAAAESELRAAARPWRSSLLDMLDRRLVKG